MIHIAGIQLYMVDLPTWHAAYDKTMSETGDEQKAIKFADWAIENLQGSGATKDMSAVLRDQGGVKSNLTMFMTFFSALGNLSRDLVKGAKSRRYSVGDVAWRASFLYTLPVFMEMLMRGEMDDPEGDEDERLSSFMTKLALYPITSVPFVRDVASAATGDYGYNHSPVSALMGRGIQAGRGLASSDDEGTASQWKNTSKLVAAALRVPGTGQAWATYEHVVDVIEDGEEFTAQQFIFGPKRD